MKNGGKIFKGLVIGKNGQIARTLLPLSNSNFELIAHDRNELDIRKDDSIEKAINFYCPDILINCSAYTNVDQAEEDQEEAMLVNAQGPKFLAEYGAKYSIPLIHISTDYVFSGNNETGYLETDVTGPINFYGLSKRAGEEAVLKYHKDSVILRTAWVYSPFGQNFAKTIWRLCQEREKLDIVSDQWGTPTSSFFLAYQIFNIAKQILDPVPPSNWQGVFHLVPDGITNWAEFAQKIADFYEYLHKKTVTIKPILSKQYPTNAKRPKYSVLNNQKVKDIYQLNFSPWEAYLAAILKMLK